jgi:hypothetical protein
VCGGEGCPPFCKCHAAACCCLLLPAACCCLLLSAAFSFGNPAARARAGNACMCGACVCVCAGGGQVERALCMLEAILDESEEEARAAGVRSHATHLGKRVTLTLSAMVMLGDGVTVLAKKVQFAAYSGERMLDLRAALGEALGVAPPKLMMVVGGMDVAGRMLGRTVKQMGLGDGGSLFVRAVTGPKKPEAAPAAAPPASADGAAPAGPPPPPPPAPAPAPAPGPPQVGTIPAVLLASNDDFFRCLAQLVGPAATAVLSPQVVSKAWALLCRLPTHAKTRVGLDSLGAVISARSDSERAAAWRSLVDPASPYWLLYALQVCAGEWVVCLRVPFDSCEPVAYGCSWRAHVS